MSQPLILDGRVVARLVEESLRKRVAYIQQKTNQTPILATILVGNDPASATYVKMKANACVRIGMTSKKIVLNENTTTQQLLQEIDALNHNTQVHGILLQHPVPKHINERECFDRIALQKDVDGVTALSFGKMALGEKLFSCATPSGILTILEHYNIELKGKQAVVVGRSTILGKPLALMLLNKHATVTICHSHTKHLSEIIKTADIVVGAVGKPRFIQGDWIKAGAVLIDAGYHPALQCGDIDLENCIDTCLAYTPVPGGVGPMTITSLMQHTVEAAEQANGIVYNQMVE